MQHLIDINYIQRGIHGEVSLWGRLYRHTLGWSAQFAYPKFFIVPANMIPFRMDDASVGWTRWSNSTLISTCRRSKRQRSGKRPFAVDPRLRLQPAGFVLAGRAGERWDGNPRKPTLKIGDRIAVFSYLETGSGIGIVKEISNGNMYYTMFNPNVIYNKPPRTSTGTSRTGVGRRTDSAPCASWSRCR